MEYEIAQQMPRGGRIAREISQEAANVVDFATSGRKSEAEQAIGLEGACSKASSELTKELVQGRLKLS